MSEGVSTETCNLYFANKGFNPQYRLSWGLQPLCLLLLSDTQKKIWDSGFFVVNHPPISAQQSLFEIKLGIGRWG